MSESTAIFWFSGTGNSLHVAEKLAASVPGASLNAVVSQLPPTLADNTHLILVAPVYAWALPAVVSRFVDLLPVGKIAKVSMVLTYGGALGGTAANAAKRFKSLGMKQVDTYSLKMVDNYPPFGGAPKPEKAEKLLIKAEKKLNGIIEKIASGASCSPSLGSRLLLYPSRLLNTFFRKSLKRADKKFSTTEACTSCGICQKVCPVDNISLQDGEPHWCGKCEQCFACFHWCPEKAILYGARTARQNRYHHPDVSLQQMMEPE